MFKSWILCLTAVAFITLSIRDADARILPKTKAQQLIESIPAEGLYFFVSN